MPSPISIRLSETTLANLSRHAARAQLAPRTLAQRWIEEGLRTADHPLVHFADGPAGRRARLLGTGADVWEVVATIKDNDGDLAAAADYLQLDRRLVDAAAAYYGAFSSEIDGWIARNQEETDRAHDTWVAAQVALSR